MSLQWQVSTDGGTTWNSAPGSSTTSPYTFAAAANMNGNKYRAFFSNTDGTATSNAATLTINDPLVTTPPTDQSVFTGESASFTSVAGGTPAPTVQWQVSNNGGSSWTDVGGAISTTYSHTVAASENTYKYHAVFTNTCSVTTSTPATLTVSPGPTATAVSSSSNPAYPTQPVTFTATITKAVGPPGPARTSTTALSGGTVQFVIDGGAPSAPVAVTVAVDGNSATAQSTPPSSWTLAGTHTVSATYSGDSNFAGSTGSLTPSQSVGQTTTAVTASANPAGVGQLVTFTATVASAPPGGAAPAGTVQFAWDGTALGGSIALSNGQATSPAISWPGTGTHNIVATYTPDASGTYTSSSNSLTPYVETVGQVRPNMSVTLPAAPFQAVYGQPITFTAHIVVPPPAAGTPAGSVTFNLDGNPAAVVGVSPAVGGAIATWTTTINAKGNHTIFASYTGDANFLPNSSPAVNFTVGFPNSGYFIAFDDGYVTPFGPAAVKRGDVGGMPLNAPIVGIAATKFGAGYWLAASDGGVFSFGNAAFHGSMGAVRLNQPIVGIAATPDGNGYWMVARDGGVFSFGSAAFHGSMGAVRLNQPVVGMAAAPDGNGYWLVASDGGIFSFGSARFFGSTGNLRLNKPVVGMASTASGRGYWMVASDGGIFTFGDAGFFGSTGAIRLAQPVTSMARTVDGQGYWMVALDGGIFSFGDAVYYGSTGLDGGPSPSAGMASMSISG